MRHIVCEYLSAYLTICTIIVPTDAEAVKCYSCLGSTCSDTYAKPAGDLTTDTCGYCSKIKSKAGSMSTLLFL